MASYYSGHIAYQNKDYDVALADFERAAESPDFKAEVDNIIPVLYYQQEKYDEVKRIVSEYEGNGKSMSPNLSLLAGEIAFKENNFAKAGEYLEKYVKVEKGAERGIYYRLGMSKLRVGDRENAIKYLSQSADGNDALAQVAAYHMGLTYISVKKEEFAYAAFDKVRNLSFDPKIQEEGAYYYAKVNYDAEDFTKVIEASEFYGQKFPSGKYQAEIAGWYSEALANAGDYQKAIEKLESIKNKSTSQKQAYQRIAYNKAVLDYNDGKFRSAVDNLVKSLQYPIDKKLQNEAYFWIGEAYAYGYKYQEALAYYSQVKSSYPIYTDALYGKGYAEFNQKKYSQALNTFKEYLDRPSNPKADEKLDALVRLADCYYVTKNYDQAITVYSGAIRGKAPNLDYVYYQKAMAELAAGRRNQANKTLDFIMSAYPTSKNLDRVYFEKGELHFEINDMNEAINWYSKFISYFPEHPQVQDVYLKRGLANKIAGSLPASVSDYKYVIDNNPASTAAEDAIKSLTEINLGGYRVANLREYQTKFTQANPKSSVAIEVAYGAAIKPFNEEDYELATQTIAEFLGTYPSSKLTNEAYLKLGQSYHYSGNKKDAVTYYKKVKGSEEVRAIKGAADLELELGMYEEAVSDYLRLKKIATNARYEEFAIIGLMQSYFGIDDYEAVNIYADQLIDKKSRYINIAYLYKGKALMIQNRNAEAVQQFTYTMTKAGVSKEAAEAQYQIGVIYRQQKNYEASIDAFKQVQKKYENYYEWVHQAYLVMADNYIDLENPLQARATLNSVIEASKNPSIIAKANEKLASLDK